MDPISWAVLIRKLPSSSSSSSAAAKNFFICFFIVILLSLIQASTAQNATNATAATDPSEVAALNSLLAEWDAPAVGLWNLSGEPCSGSAINNTEFEDPMNNPAIKCDCTYDNGATCHITQLRVYALNKRGVIPETIVAFKFLTLLKIDQNFFTGPLPSFIANLTRLSFLSIAHNVFSGPVPKELGNLKALTGLSLGGNNFSGSLPPELGNLVLLKEIYINSAGLSGEIPSTFANLTRMETLWASDNAFTGKIPDFIANWPRMKSLRLQGNSFEGPIPSNLSRLTSMDSLRISDLSNVSSTLDFVTNMKNLTDLNLRNALISGTIPAGIGDLSSLNRLDLSFNNLTGPVPGGLFNMSNLQYLFLGNNSLTGDLPSGKSAMLQTIDLSYNFLSGSFPSWISSSSLQLNLVVNNFTFDSSNRSVLPGLNCLQRDFECNRNSPRYARFAINSGGTRFVSADGTEYEAETASLGAASFNVTSTQKWAVSNAGLYADRQNPTYTTTNLLQVSRTNTPELFQSSRSSPGSLRYYGLGLENGNYTVNLLFAETGFPAQSSQTWQSLARRVFDIYVQGSLRLKDFDISKEAGGVERAITRTFNVTVSDNHLEIHLFWAGKGTCCTPVQGYYGPTISALSVVPDFVPTVSGMPPVQKKNRTGLIVGISVSVGLVSLMLIFGILYMRRRRRNEDEEVFFGIGPRPNTFSYAQLKTATDDFSAANRLGEGGYGSVYKGVLYDGREVAVKRLSVASNQGTSEFVTEIATISAVQHRNLVKLHGCCIEGSRRLLVYEYLENKSLDKALFGKEAMQLDWPTRFSICLGTARGLAYLHEESSPRIVHRDVKASNILLDAELCPKISDFGLAKLYDDKKTHISTRVAGTIGYLAPEYAMRGHLTEKADVFGFGVVALEILSGRPNSDDTLDGEKIYLLEWAWTLHESNQGLSLVDPSCLPLLDESEALRVINIALLCTQASPSMRPPMSRVVAMLTEDIEVNAVISKPSYLTDWNFKDISGTFSSDNTGASSSSYSKDGKGVSPVDLNQSPLYHSEPKLTDLIGEGR